MKQRMVEHGAAHAALVVRDGDEGEEAIAWAEYGTPVELPNIHHRRQYLADLQAAGEVEPGCRITCIFVDKRFLMVHAFLTTGGRTVAATGTEPATGSVKPMR